MKTRSAAWNFATLWQLAIAASVLHVVHAAGVGSVPPQSPVQPYRPSLVHVYVWPKCESFAINASGKVAAIAITSKEGHTTIYAESLTAGHSERRKLVDFPQSISMSVDAMCWSRSGRYLAVCGDGLVGIVDTSATRPILRTVQANWIHAIFFKDESALLGVGPKARAAGDELEEIDVSALVPTVRTLPECPIDYWNEQSPFVATDDNTIAVVGTGIRVSCNGRALKSGLWGENSLYGITAGPFVLAGKPFVVNVCQPSTPHGRDQIFEVEATYLNTYSINGKHLGRIEWQKHKRINSVYISPSGHLFVQLTSGYTGRVTLYEYQLLPVRDHR